jgi:hypothetical protein
MMVRITKTELCLFVAAAVPGGYIIHALLGAAIAF